MGKLWEIFLTILLGTLRVVRLLQGAELFLQDAALPRVVEICKQRKSLALMKPTHVRHEIGYFSQLYTSSTKKTKIGFLWHLPGTSHMFCSKTLKRNLFRIAANFLEHCGFSHGTQKKILVSCSSHGDKGVTWCILQVRQGLPHAIKPYLYQIKITTTKSRSEDSRERSENARYMTA